jgi:hypothetical protein
MRAFVDTTHARIVCVSASSSESMADYDATPEQRAFLARHNLILKHQWFNTHHVEYREAIVAPGDTLTLCGTAVREPDPEGRVIDATDYRNATAMRLVFSGSKKEPLMITDDPRAVTP